jgi:FMN-dependent NADH-azoreductase
VAHLLHIDASIDPHGSTSRAVSRVYVGAWREANPDGKVTYRDLAVAPPPHLSWAALSATHAPVADHTPEQAAAHAVREELIAELETADELLLGVPMYNFGIPSTVKAWLDHVIVIGRTADSGAGDGALAGKKVTVVVAQGGSYRPGTPKEGWDHQQPHLAHALESLGAKDVEFIGVEMTLSTKVPALAEFTGLFEASRARARETARARATAA